MRKLGDAHHNYGKAGYHSEVKSVNEGYLAMAAAIINQAVEDYRHLRFASNEESGLKKEERVMAWQDAKDFLFTDRIRVFCKEFGITNVIKVSRVRALARRPYE